MRKTVLITGSSRGIGKATAEYFGKNGYNVVINYNKSENDAFLLKDRLIKQGVDCIAVKCDISKSEEVKSMFATIYKTFKKIDVLVNNAGISFIGLITETDESKWNELFDANVKGMYLVTNEALKNMISEKDGKIINVSSMWGISGASCEVAYSATKSAVIGYTKALAKEVGLSNINVNCVCPGVINTDMNSHLDEKTLNELKEATSLNRIGEPENVAEVIFFLANASFVTGQVISVDGGFIG